MKLLRKPHAAAPHLADAPLLEVEELRVAFGAQPVVHGISFSLRRGECLALVGESGSGKSVSSRALVGLAGPGASVQARRLALEGENLLALPPRRWQALRGARIGFVMQDALGSLDPLKRVGDEVGEPLRLHATLTRAQREARVVGLLRAAGVPEPELRARQLPQQLSGGLRQRALIASAIACNPALLIADEPTTALDATVQAQVLELLAGLRRADTAMLIVSHDFSVVSRLADRVAVMQHGRIVEQGPVAQVLEQPAHPYTRALLDAARAVHGGAAPPRARPVPIQAQPPGPLIEVHEVAKRYPGPDGRERPAVDGASFVLHPGETLGIVGESGSGKTTLTRIVLGLETPDAGHVLRQGLDWRRLPAAEQRRLRRGMQVVFQDPLASFDPRYTVERVLHEALAVAGHATPEARGRRALELLESVKLDPRHLARRPIELSGGQRQRVAIARALAAEPQVLVCDEPVSALDVSVQAQVLDLLADLRERLGLSCLFISHDLGVIRRVSDRVLVMKDGRIVESAPAEQLFAQPRHPYTRELLAAGTRPWARAPAPSPEVPKEALRA
ncbi:MAG: ABC transporter ATP-binding protein [Aquabacterium sp.]|jgi:peptide/nickel transport system ATP-binding protein|nr:MAG: ABC transporter ATP-binding protein [Aquabacterium sp.]